MTGFIAVATMVLLAASAPAAILPGEAIGEDVVAVLWLDATTDGKQLMDAAAALLGDEAKQLAEPLADLEKMREPFVKAGGTGLAIVVRGPDERGRMQEPYLLLPLADRANPDEAMAAVKAVAGETVEKFSDRCLIGGLQELGWRPQPGVKQKAIEKLLAAQGAAPAAPASIVFIPNDALRKMIAQQKPALPLIEEQMPGITSLLELAAQACNMKSLTLAATLGDAPKLSLVAEGADAPAVAALQEKMKAASEGLKRLEAKMKAQGGRAAGEGAVVINMFGVLLSGETKAAGTQMTMTVQGEPLKQAAGTVVRGVMEARKAAARALVASNIHQVAVAIHAYAHDHNGLMPDGLADVAEYVGGKEALARLLAHPQTGEKIGMIYVKPANKIREIKNLTTTAMLFEALKGKKKMGGCVGYADGHVQTGKRGDDADDDLKFE